MLFLAAHAVAFCGGLGLTFLMPQLFPVESYAKYAWLSSILNFVVPLASFGLPPVIIRNYKNGSERNFSLKQLVKYCGYIGLALSSSVTIGIGLIQGIEWGIVLLIIATAVTSAHLIIRASGYRAGRAGGLYFITVAAQKPLLAVLLVAFLFLGLKRNFEVFLLAYIASNLICILLARKHYLPSDENKSRETPEKLSAPLKLCLSLTFMNAVVMLAPVLDRSFLISVGDEQILAEYGFNSEFAQKILATLLILMKVAVYPRIFTGVRLEEKRRYYQTLYRCSGFGLCAIVLIWLLIPYLYNPLLNILSVPSDYQNSDLFALQASYAVLNLLTYIALIGTIMAGRSYVVSCGAILFLIIQAIGLYLLVPKFSGIGAALALIIAQGFLLIFYLAANARNLKGYASKAIDISKETALQNYHS